MASETFKWRRIVHTDRVAIYELIGHPEFTVKGSAIPGLTSLRRRWVVRQDNQVIAEPERLAEAKDVVESTIRNREKRS